MMDKNYNQLKELLTKDSYDSNATEQLLIELYKKQELNEESTLLLYAAKHNHIQVLYALLSFFKKNNLEFEFNKVDSLGNTVLHYFAKNNQLVVLKEIFQTHDKPLILFNKHDFTPIHLAAQEKNSRIIDFLEKIYPQSLTYTTRDKLISPLSLAAASGDFNLFKSLYEKSYHIIPVESQKSLMSYAATGGNIKIILHLIEKGHCPSECLNPCKIPLHYAALSGKEDAFEKLLQFTPEDSLKRFGIRPQFPVKKRSKEFKELKSSPFESSSLSLEGKRTNNSLSSSESNSPSSSESNHESTVQSHSLLIWAVKGQNKKIIQKVLDITEPSFLDQQDEYQKSALHYSMQNPQASIINLLLDKGLSLEKKDIKKLTPLCLVCRSGNLGLFQILKSRLDHNLMERFPNLLHHGAYSGNMSMVKSLLRLGYSPLHLSDDLFMFPDQCAALQGQKNIFLHLYTKRKNKFFELSESEKSSFSDLTPTFETKNSSSTAQNLDKKQQNSDSHQLGPKSSENQKTNLQKTEHLKEPVPKQSNQNFSSDINFDLNSSSESDFVPLEKSPSKNQSSGFLNPNSEESLIEELNSYTAHLPKIHASPSKEDFFLENLFSPQRDDDQGDDCLFSDLLELTPNAKHQTSQQDELFEDSICSSPPDRLSSSTRSDFVPSDLLKEPLTFEKQIKTCRTKIPAIERDDFTQKNSSLDKKSYSLQHEHLSLQEKSDPFQKESLSLSDKDLNQQFNSKKRKAGLEAENNLLRKKPSLNCPDNFQAPLSSNCNSELNSDVSLDSDTASCLSEDLQRASAVRKKDRKLTYLSADQTSSGQPINFVKKITSSTCRSSKEKNKIPLNTSKVRLKENSGAEQQTDCSNVFTSTTMTLEFERKSSDKITSKKHHIQKIQGSRNPKNPMNYYPLVKKDFFYYDSFSEISTLHFIATSPYSDLLKSLLREGYNPQATDSLYRTPLISAVIHNRLENVKILWPFTEDPFKKDYSGSTIIHYAAASKNLDLFHFVASHLKDLDLRDNTKSTAMHIAAYHGNKDIVLYCLENKANYLAVDSELKAPIHVATFRGHLPIVLLLLKEYEKDKFLKAVDEIVILSVYCSQHIIMNHMILKQYCQDRQQQLKCHASEACCKFGRFDILKYLLLVTDNRDDQKKLIDKGVRLAKIFHQDLEIINFCAQKYLAKKQKRRQRLTLQSSCSQGPIILPNNIKVVVQAPAQQLLNSQNYLLFKAPEISPSVDSTETKKSTKKTPVKKNTLLPKAN